MKLLTLISRFIFKRPMKLILLSLAVVLLFAVGAPNVEMATGNDTFIERETDVYQDNLALEREFGGESLIVLYEADNLDDLLTVSNLEHMKGLETRLTVQGDVFTVMSPVSIVEQMATKQSEQYEEGIEEVIEGLDTMGDQLIEIGENVEQNADENQPGLPDLDAKMAELDQGLQQMIEGQTKLEEGTISLVQGYGQFGNQTKQVAENLLTFSKQLRKQTELQNQMQQEQLKKKEELQKQMQQEQRNKLEALEKQMQQKLRMKQEEIRKQIQQGQLDEQEGLKKQGELEKQTQEELLKKQEELRKQMPQQEHLDRETLDPKNGSPSGRLQQISEQLMMLSDKMIGISAETASLPDVPRKTIEGLQNMQGGIGNQEGQMNELKQQQREQMKDMQELGEGLTTMGDNLVTMSENLTTMVQYSDVMHPTLPEKQDTLDEMVYEDNGELRSIFNEMVIDEQYMTLIVKLKGDVPDARKSEIVAEIKDYLESHALKTTKTMVSGKPVLDDAVRSSMQESMQKMMGLAMVLMVVILSFVFRVRWRILPLAMILVAVIGTVGLMGWLSIPITMVSMAVFPILIGLGIDYGIQFQNRYVEEMEKGETRHEE